jgi:hypothetical protein
MKVKKVGNMFLLEGRTESDHAIVVSELYLTMESKVGPYEIKMIKGIK